MEISINWEKLRKEATGKYGRFVSAYAETRGVESEFALELVYKALVQAGIEVNKPDFK